MVPLNSLFAKACWPLMLFFGWKRPLQGCVVMEIMSPWSSTICVAFFCSWHCLWIQYDVSHPDLPFSALFQELTGYRPLFLSYTSLNFFTLILPTSATHRKSRHHCRSVAHSSEHSQTAHHSTTYPLIEYTSWIFTHTQMCVICMWAQ